jgi:hypothetical protein
MSWNKQNKKLDNGDAEDSKTEQNIKRWDYPELPTQPFAPLVWEASRNVLKEGVDTTDVCWPTLS